MRPIGSTIESGKDRGLDVFGPFSPGHSVRVYRLQRKGISLDLQRDLMQPSTPIWEAWLAFLTQQAMGQPTYVLHDAHNGEAFIQVRYRPHQSAADVTYLAPSLADHGRAVHAWVHLLDGAAIEAAGQGIQRVFANLPASGAEVDAFHQAGFTLYAGEDIYCLDPRLTGALGEPSPAMRPQRAEDWPAVQKLCVAITPQRVRQAEGGIAPAGGWEKSCQRYVLRALETNDLVAALTVCAARHVNWLRLLLHPDARPMAAGVVSWGLAKLAAQPSKPIYINVRQYQSGVREALQEVGFEPLATRGLMVKHTVAWIKTPFQESVPSLKSSAEPVPPAYHINGEREMAPSNGQLAAETQSD
jgi:hypothetical protein